MAGVQDGVAGGSRIDWSDWMALNEQERRAALRRYRNQVRRDSEANAQRWAAMSPVQRARYPEAAA